MAIVIQNISKNRGLKYGEGKQIYEVLITKNQLLTKMFEFEHVFEDGLSKCFEAAAKAAKEYEKNMNVNAYMQLIEEYLIGSIGERSASNGK